MSIVPTELLGDVGDACELPVLENAVRDAQAAHVRGLRRRNVKDAVIAPAEIVGWLWRLVVTGLRHQPRIGIERMLVALDLLLIVELAAARDRAVLRFQVDRVRSDRL